MNTTKQTATDSIELPITRTLSESERPDVFADIYQDSHNIVIWRRTLKPDLLLAVNNLLSLKEPIKIESVVTPHNALKVMHESLQDAENTKSLISDIDQLVDMFCVLFDLKQAGLRLTTLDHAMCPRFHVDKVPCRLVTTYQGTATQWLPHNAVDRTKLGTGNNGLPDDLSGLYQSDEAIQQLNNGDVALLKGELWEGNENAGLVHRSPNLETAEKRLLLTLDFLS